MRAKAAHEKGHFGDYLPEDAWVALVETADLQEQGRHYLERITDAKSLFSVAEVFARLLRFPSVTVSALPSPSVEATFRLHVESVERFSGDVSTPKLPQRRRRRARARLAFSGAAAAAAAAAAATSWRPRRRRRAAC